MTDRLQVASKGEVVVERLSRALEKRGFIVVLYLLTPSASGDKPTRRLVHRPARRYQRGRSPTILFSDVASLEEAKVELLEVVQFLRWPAKFARLGAHVPRGCCWPGRRAVARRCWQRL